MRLFEYLSTPTTRPLNFDAFREEKKDEQIKEKLFPLSRPNKIFMFERLENVRILPQFKIKLQHV